MIIVEGPDGAGKSTLVAAITKAYKLKVGKRATKNRDFLYKTTRQDTYTALAGAAKHNLPPVVWDRLYFSEFAYYRVVGRPCEFSPHDQIIVERMIPAVALVIWCLPPFSMVKDNVAKSHQMKGVKKNLYDIYTSYELMFSRAVMSGVGNHVKYDYTRENSVREVQKTVGDYIELRSKILWTPFKEK